MKISNALKTGFSFGLTSGIITTLGLMVGLNSGTHSKMIVIGGILTIAFADAFSDALGMHVSQESEAEHTAKEIWQATFATFLSKLIFALTFVVPVLIFSLNLAVIISAIWGLLLLAIFSYFVAKNEKLSPTKVIAEHLLIAILVILVTNYIGGWINKVFS